MGMSLRSVLAVMTLALASLHCSAGTDVVDSSQAGDTSAPAEPQPAHEHAAKTPEIEEPAIEKTRAPYDTGACNCVLSAPVRGPDGGLYTVGTFGGTITLGDFTLTSRGMNDILLMKQDIGGHVVWALSAGSPSAERAARLTLQEVGSGGITIFALTDGGADCGAGALPEWGEGSYFLCHYRTADGVLVDGASFPRGS